MTVPPAEAPAADPTAMALRCAACGWSAPLDSLA